MSVVGACKAYEVGKMLHVLDNRKKRLRLGLTCCMSWMGSFCATPTTLVVVAVELVVVLGCRKTARQASKHQDQTTERSAGG
jgi:hypothetical protein